MKTDTIKPATGKTGQRHLYCMKNYVPESVGYFPTGNDTTPRLKSIGDVCAQQYEWASQVNNVTPRTEENSRSINLTCELYAFLLVGKHVAERAEESKTGPRTFRGLQEYR